MSWRSFGAARSSPPTPGGGRQDVSREASQRSLWLLMANAPCSTHFSLQVALYPGQSLGLSSRPHGRWQSLNVKAWQSQTSHNANTRSDIRQVRAVGLYPSLQTRRPILGSLISYQIVTKTRTVIVRLLASRPSPLTHSSRQFRKYTNTQICPGPQSFLQRKHISADFGFHIHTNHRQTHLFRRSELRLGRMMVT